MFRDDLKVAAKYRTKTVDSVLKIMGFKLSAKNLRHEKITLYLVVVTFLYLIIGVLGITTSHTAILSGSETETSDLIFGSPRNERSDEYLRGTPRTLGVLRGIDDDAYTPFDYSGTESYKNVKNSFLSNLVYFTNPIHEIGMYELAKLVPLSMGFALLWWSSTLVLFVSLPLLFYFSGLKIRFGALLALGITLTTNNNWFSNLPVGLFAQSVASACYFLLAIKISSSRISKIFKILGIGLAAIYSGRLAFSVVQYPPWGFPILGVVGIYASSLVMMMKPRRRVIALGLSILVIGTLGVAMVVALNRNLYNVILDTVYPGQRRETGVSTENSLWSGGISWFFQSSYAKTNGLSNPEFVRGPVFLLIPLLFLSAKSIFQREIINSWLKYFLAGSLVLFGILISWIIFPWPKWMLTLNPLQLIPVGRAEQILGVVVLFPLFVYMGSQGKIKTNFSWLPAFSISLVTVLIVFDDTRDIYRSLFSSTDYLILVFSLILVFLVVFCLLNLKNSMISVLPLLFALALSSLTINPIVRGLGVLDNSNAVKTITSLGQDYPKRRWASNSVFHDALITSTGVYQLSGQQPLGPNESFWRRLDIENRFENVWNRGQSYVTFAWDPRPDWTIWNPSPDLIQIVISPCNERLQDLDLGWLMSADPLTYDCLKETANVEWMKGNLIIYEFHSSAGEIISE